MKNVASWKKIHRRNKIVRFLIIKVNNNRKIIMLFFLLKIFILLFSGDTQNG